MRTAPFVLALAGTLALPAQQPASPFRFVPADSAMVLRVAAPAKWQQQFATTQLVKLLRGPTLGPLVAQLEGAVDTGVASMREDGVDADVVEKLLAEWQGDLVVAARVDADTLAEAMQNDEPPLFGIVIALTGDGSYDMARLAAELEKAAEREPPPGGYRDLQVGDVRLRVADLGGIEATVPAVVDGGLVMVFGNDVTKFAAQALGDGARYTAPTVPGAPAGSTLQFDMVLGPLMKAVVAAASEQPAPFDVGALLGDLGLTALDGLSLVAGADGKHAALDGEIRLAAGERGIFAMLPQDTRPAKLLRLAPTDGTDVTVSAIDLGALYRTIGRIWTGLEDVAPMTWEQAQTAFAEEMKVRLKEDVFDRFGTEILVMQDAPDPAAEPDLDNPLAGIAGTCIALTLRDGKAFGQSLETMLRARGLHAARKTEDYQGTPIHRLRLMGVLEIEYATTDDLLLLAIGSGESSVRSLRTVLDLRADPPAEPAFPPAVEERLALLPANWSSLSITSMSNLARTFAGIAEMGVEEELGEVPPPLRAFLDALPRLGGEMERLGLQTMVGINTFTSRGLGFASRW